MCQKLGRCREKNLNRIRISLPKYKVKSYIVKQFLSSLDFHISYLKKKFEIMSVHNKKVSVQYGNDMVFPNFLGFLYPKGNGKNTISRQIFVFVTVFTIVIVLFYIINLSSVFREKFLNTKSTTLYNYRTLAEKLFSNMFRNVTTCEVDVVYDQPLRRLRLRCIHARHHIAVRSVRIIIL